MDPSEAGVPAATLADEDDAFWLPRDPSGSIYIDRRLVILSE